MAPAAPLQEEVNETPNQRMLSSLPPTLPPEELLDIGIAPDMVTRYSVLKKKKALAADPKTIYCPRQWCQAPSRASVENVEASMKISGNDYWLPDRNAVPQPIEEHVYEADSKKKVKETVSPLKEKLQVCSTCSLAFCSKCLGKFSMHSTGYRYQTDTSESIMARRFSDLQAC